MNTLAMQSSLGSPLTYGSDQAGLVWGYLFTPEGPGRLVDTNTIVQWLKNPETRQSEEFAWLHFDLVSLRTEPWLREHLELSEDFFESLHEATPSTRVEYADGTLIAIANDVLFEFAFDATQISTMWLSVERHVLVSARKKPLRSVDQLRAAVKKGEVFGSSVALLVHLLQAQADVLTHISRDSVPPVDTIEDQMLRGHHGQNRALLGQRRSVLVRLKRLLAPEPAALFRLLAQPPEWMSEDDAEELRQSTEEFAVALQDVAALEERIKLLQEEMAAQVQEKNNRTLFVLTVFTVLALPTNITSALLGMNVGGIPLADSPYGFWTIVGFVFALSLSAAYWLFRRL